MDDAPGVLCVHAHPDDESITTGGVLCLAVQRGFRAAVVTCTGGERGEVFGAGMDPAEVGPRLPELRREELTRALDILGAGPPRWLGYRDSGMAGTDGNDDPASFWRADVDQAVGRLVAHLREFRPDVVVTYDPYGGYGHPDHVQTHRVGLLAAEACAVPALYPGTGEAWRIPKVYLATIPKSAIAVWASELAARGLPSPFDDVDDVGHVPMGTPDEHVTTVVDVRAVLDRKMTALRAHASQLSPDSFFLNIPDDLRATAFGTEWFARLRSDVAVPDGEDDLFTGLHER